MLGQTPKVHKLRRGGLLGAAALGASPPCRACKHTAAPLAASRCALLSTASLGRMGPLLSRIAGRRGAACYAVPSSVEPALGDAAPQSLRLAVIGDVHGAWQPEQDLAALRALRVDVAVFVGDMGNENVELVQQIAACEFPKAVILGNHDAWWTMKSRTGPRRLSSPQTCSAADLLAAHAAEQGEREGLPAGGRVVAQLRALGPAHLGFNRMSVAGRPYSLVGSRPFSKGGGSETVLRDFVSELYPGVNSFAASAALIAKVAGACPPDDALILVGHNGPLGLGSAPQDMCGVDWERKGGDHGDADLRAALQALWGAGRRVALVLFGHMHHVLHKSQRGRPRRMVAVHPTHGTVFLNAATVPRIMAARGPNSPPGAQQHHFLVVELQEGEATSAWDTWVEVSKAPVSSASVALAPAGGDASGAVSSSSSSVAAERNAGGPAGTSGQQAQPRYAARVLKERQVLKTLRGDGDGVVKCAWNAYDDRFEYIAIGSEVAGPGSALGVSQGPPLPGAEAQALQGAGSSLGGSVDASYDLQDQGLDVGPAAAGPGEGSGADGSSERLDPLLAAGGTATAAAAGAPR